MRTGKLGVTLERLSAQGSQLVDASCRQLIGNPDTNLGNTRWVNPTSEEWKALNIERITHFYSCDTLLKCLTRFDNHRGVSDLNLRTRLQHGIEAIQQILKIITWGDILTVKTAENQIDAMKMVETELSEIWKATETTTFDPTELTITDGLLKGMSSFLARLKQEMLKEASDAALRSAQASSSAQPSDSTADQGDQADPPFGPAIVGLLDDRNLIAKQKIWL